MSTRKRNDKSKASDVINKRSAIAFKKLMEKSAAVGEISKIELLLSLGFRENNAKQIFSNEDRNLPAYLVPAYCKRAGNNLLAEWIAAELGMKLVPAKANNSGNDASQLEIQRLKKKLATYKGLINKLMDEADDIDA